jgi:methyl-accepting chemotaxis protein
MNTTISARSSARLRNPVLILALHALLFSSCAFKNYRAPITGFQTASNRVILATKSYYELANKVERDHLVDDQLATQETIDPQKLRTAGETFRSEDIAVRLDALGVLSDYGALLLQLATSDAPQDVTTQVTALNTSVGALSDRLTRLCTDCTAANNKFKAGFGTVASAIKPILDTFVRSKIQKGLDSSIQNAEKPISDLTTLLREDLHGLYERRKQAVGQALSDAIRSYNDEVKKGTAASPERLQTLARQVKLAADRVAELPNASPDPALAAMDKAHRALVTFAKNKKSVQTLADLSDAVDAFAVQAQQVGQAIRTLATL